MNEWQPIETKPKGETLLYYPPEYGRNAKSEMIKIGINCSPRKATHWMPLPMPPNAELSRDEQGEESA